MPKEQVTIILGAGFSKNAKVPLQSEIDILDKDQFANSDSDLNKVISQIIKEFLRKVFYWNGQPLTIPSLEDIFTQIDLSAGSGHNLGQIYDSKKLRAIRRLLIYRIFAILDKYYANSEDILQLLNHYSREDNTANYVVLNWDIVLERHLEDLERKPKIDYCINAESWFPDYGNEPAVKIAKVHGSSNWVYCDNCRTLFYDRNSKLSLQIKAGLLESDFSLFVKENILAGEANKCKKCGCPVGPHIATFSLKKSFRTHAFTSSWLAAEQLLDQATRWVFIGYSLPQADYEFKHLLKTSQLKIAKKEKKIDVVILSDKEIERRYLTLFGSKNVTIYSGGLNEYVEKLFKGGLL